MNQNSTTVTANNSNTNNSTSNSTSNNSSVSNNTNTSTINNTSNSNNVNENTSNVTQNSTSNNTNTNVSSSTDISQSTSEISSNANNTSNNTNNNTSNNTSTQRVTQRIESPPPSAIAPSIGSSYSQDLCTTGISGAVQSQLFGFSGGRSITDENCERIKLGKTLYDMGMRVAAVSLMCQDERVFDAMRMAGTPCPYEGLIGAEAQIAWDTAEEEELTENESKPSNRRNCQPRGGRCR